jgi:hypothetical protein
MLRRLFIVGFICSAGVASAQTVVLTPTGSTSDTVRFNSDGCSNVLQVTWTSTLLVAPCGSLSLWSTEGECGDTPTGTDVRYTDVSQASVTTLRTGTFNINLDELPAFKYSDAGVVCGTQSIEKQHKVCGSYTSSSGVVGAACVVQRAQSLNVIYDELPPVSPTIDLVDPQDKGVKLQFTASTDTFAVHFDARAQGETDFTERSSVEISTGTGASIGNLVNGTTYDIRARAEDAAGNFSEPSEIVSTTPRHTAGFWSEYRTQGGTDQGGCSGVAGLPFVLTGGLWLIRRKRNR